MSSITIRNLESSVSQLCFPDISGENRHCPLTTDIPSVRWLDKLAVDLVELFFICSEHILPHFEKLWGILLQQPLQLHSVYISCNFAQKNRSSTQESTVLQGGLLTVFVHELRVVAKDVTRMEGNIVLKATVACENSAIKLVCCSRLLCACDLSSL